MTVQIVQLTSQYVVNETMVIGNGDVDKCTNANSAVNSCKEGIASANTCEFLSPSLAEAQKPPGQQQNGSACTGSDICCVQIARPETSGKGITFGECLSEDQCIV